MAKLGKVLVGDDGTVVARRAVDEATELAAALHADVVAVGVVEGREDVGPLSAELDHRCGEVARERGVACECKVLTGDPRDVLSHEVVDSGADVVVVGDTGHWTLGRPHLGSVAGHLAHHSPRPVVVVPNAARPVEHGHLVVGIDGVDEPDAHIEVSFRGAHPVEGLLELAEETDAAMIVVGSRGHASVHRLLLGGTAIELLPHSQRPVGVVPLELAEATAV